MIYKGNGIHLLALRACIRNLFQDYFLRFRRRLTNLLQELVDGGLQRRSFTDVSDGVSALVKIIENKGGIADSKIYNIGNPENDLSIKELASLMLEMSYQYPEYEAQARNVNIVEVTSGEYYGKGYQDIQSRVPFIENTCTELNWAPTVEVGKALQKIMDTYRHEVASAQALLGRN